MKFTFLNVETASEVVLYGLNMEDIRQVLEDGLVLVNISNLEG